jgi:hypothetical protein
MEKNRRKRSREEAYLEQSTAAFHGGMAAHPATVAPSRG